MSRFTFILLLIVIFSSSLYSQEVKTDNRKVSNINTTEKALATQDATDKVEFKNETGNAIITITDEGSNIGSITLPPGSVPVTPDNKLYNVAGGLHFNGSALGTTSSGAGWVKNGTSVTLATITDYVGIGTSDPSVNLDMKSSAANFASRIRLSNSDGTHNLFLSGGSSAANPYISIREGDSLLFTKYNGINTELMRITYDGNVGIGTSDPSATLHIQGFFRLVNGTQGDGKVLVSDENGYATWHTYTIGATEINDLTDARYDDGESLFLGNGAGANDDGTNYNTAVGKNALYTNTTGSYNTANGYQSLYRNTTGGGNTANGYYSLYSNTEGNNNTANGYNSLYSNKTGHENTANGYQSLHRNTTGDGNTANGYNSLYWNAIGVYNTSNGHNSLYGNTEGSRNTSNGYFSLYENTIGDDNTANGAQSLYLNREGNRNTANGYYSLYSNATGSDNTAVGYYAGPNSSALSNTTALGSSARVSADNQVMIGNSLVSSISGQVAWSFPSDGRYKRNISEDVKGIDFIMGLRPVTYNLDMEMLSEKLGENITIDDQGRRVRREFTPAMRKARTKKASKRNSGFVAQEVEELTKEIGYDFSGVEIPENEQSLYRLRYAEFVVPLVKAVQEQQEMIKEQRELIAELRKEMDELNNR